MKGNGDTARLGPATIAAGRQVADIYGWGRENPFIKKEGAISDRGPGRGKIKMWGGCGTGQAV